MINNERKIWSMTAMVVEHELADTFRGAI